MLVCDGVPSWPSIPGDRKADTGKVARLVEFAEAVARTRRSSTRPGSPGERLPFPLERVTAVLVERTLLRHGTLFAGAARTATSSRSTG